MSKRGSHGPAFKARVAIQALKGARRVSELVAVDRVGPGFMGGFTFPQITPRNPCQPLLDLVLVKRFCLPPTRC